jgi:hypothetical protein
MARKDKAQPDSCFVVMPFGGLSDEYYQKIYAPAIADAGLAAVRADEVFRAGSILQDIVDLLSMSTVVIADITESNRNVHYELGLAHALGKPTVLVAPENNPLFFDVGQERMLTYNKDDAFWGEKLRASISRALSATLQDPASAVPTAFMHLKPARHEADEVTFRLRRIEEQLSELLRSGAAADPPTRLRGLLKGLPAAEAEAERLLDTMPDDETLAQLRMKGYGAAMAESAVATARSRRRRARSDEG